MDPLLGGRSLVPARGEEVDLNTSPEHRSIGKRGQLDNPFVCVK